MKEKQQRYESLVRAFHADIYRYAFWLVRDKAIAEDIVQETFLRAWRSLDALNDEKAAKSWLITIVRRENARRFEKKQLDIVALDETVLNSDYAAEKQRQTDSEEIRKLIATLHPDYQEPMLLQLIFGFSGDEIAAQLNLNKNTVMTRLFRARQQIRALVNSDDASKRGRTNG